MAKKLPAAKPAYRVIRITDSTRNTFKTYRDKTSQKNHEALASLLEAELPKLIEGLAALGIKQQPAKTKQRPIRLPFTPNSLALLKGAANSTGLPQTLLLKVCLAAAQPAKRGRKVQS